MKYGPWHPALSVALKIFQNLQSRVKQAALAIHSGTSNTDRTISFFTQAAQVFQQLQLSSQRVNEMATQTAAAGHIAASSRHIRQLSETLFGLVGRFRMQ